MSLELLPKVELSSIEPSKFSIELLKQTIVQHFRETGDNPLEMLVKAEAIIQLLDGIRADLKEDVVFNYMSIYERISVLSKQEWNKIFDLGEQTKLFNNLELSNLKSISKGVLNRERVKESGLKKADESLSKLKKFGIKY